MTLESHSILEKLESELQQLKISDNVLFRQVEDEGILLNTSSGTYYSLSETSILFWQAFVENKSLTTVLNGIIEEYEVEKEVVVRDIQSFVQDLLDCGIISLIEE